MSSKRLIALDTETTGFSVSENHRIIEIGAVEIIEGQVSGNEFQAFLNPDRDVPLEATNVHGITTEMLKDKPRFHEMANDLLSFIDGALLIIHNAAFDIKFLNFELNKAGMSDIQNEVFDTTVLSKRLNPGGKTNLDSLSKRYKIDASQRSKHGALIDARILGHVYLKMIEEQSLRRTATSEEIRWADPSSRRPRPVREIRQPNEEEAAAHLSFIQRKVKDALWLSGPKF
jgi:DNA polymerase-3 subunit epsilon